MKRERWSHSKLNSLLYCGEAFRREREATEDDWAPPSSAMVRGTAVHEVAAEAHGRQINAKEEFGRAKPKSIILREALPTAEEAADLAATSFDRQKRLTGIVAPGYDEPEKRVIGRDKDSAVKMSRHYVGQHAEYVDPVDAEVKVVAELAESNITLSGIIDVRTIEPGGKRGVRDIKTGMRMPPKEAAHESAQLSMYALLDKLSKGTLADVFALDYVVQDPKAFTKPYVVHLETTRTEEDLVVMEARLNNAILTARKGAFVANGVGTWKCSPKWCRWWSSCKFVSRARS